MTFGGFLAGAPALWLDLNVGLNFAPESFHSLENLWNSVKGWRPTFAFDTEGWHWFLNINAAADRAALGIVDACRSLGAGNFGSLESILSFGGSDCNPGNYGELKNRVFGQILGETLQTTGYWVMFSYIGNQMLYAPINAKLLSMSTYARDNKLVQRMFMTTILPPMLQLYVINTLGLFAGIDANLATMNKYLPKQIQKFSPFGKLSGANWYLINQYKVSLKKTIKTMRMTFGDQCKKVSGGKTKLTFVDLNHFF